MIRIAIFLTAIPLAAALAMAFNALLDRRLAAVRQTARHRTPLRLRGLLALLALTSITAPASAAIPAGETCAEIECSLSVEAERVEDLWKANPTRVVLVAQSRIPVWIEPSEELQDEPDDGSIKAASKPAESPKPASTKRSTERP